MNRFKPSLALVTAVTAITALTFASAASAQMVAQPEGVLSLTSTASVEVAKDVLSIAFSTTREGADAATVQSGLKQALEAALVEARKAARPVQIDVRAGNFSLYPRYSPKGAISGWQGTAEMTVEGRDLQGIAQLSGRIATMTISRVQYDLSREAREKVEADVAAQAIAKFRAQAQELSKQFGYTGYVVREVNVSTNAQGPYPVPMMRAKAMAASDEALPVEPGKGVVTSSVNGSVQMAK